MQYQALNRALVASCALLAAFAPAQDRAPDRIALLVGVADYPEEMLRGPEPFSPLTGPANDVALVQKLLTSRFGFAKQNIKTLKNSEATHEAIVRAFDEWLIRRAGPETQVVFWFSGHGSRIPDTSGLETRKEAKASASDSSYVTYDSRVEGRFGSYDFSDDELHSLLRALAAKTPYTLVVTDSCYSGGGTRGAGDDRATAKAFPAGKAPFEPAAVRAFWPEHVRFLDDNAPERLARPVPYVHIAACADYQMAFEKRFEENGQQKTFGLLTWALADVLERAKPGATIRQVAVEASAQISALGYAQTVWWEGNIDRVLFEARFEEPSRDYQAFCYGRLIKLSAGRVHGLSGDVRFKIKQLDGTVVGEAKASTVSAVHSYLRWVGENEHHKTYKKKALLAEVSSPPSTFEPLRIRVADDELGKQIEASRWATRDSGEDWDYRAERGEKELVLVTRAGLVARRVALGEGFEQRLLQALAQEHRFRSLWEWSGARGELELRVRFVEPTKAEASVEPRVAAVSPAIDRDAGKGESRAFPAQCRTRVPPFTDDGGSFALLEVWNVSDEDLHVVVVSLGENREVNVLFPVAGARDNLIRSKERRLVPVSLGSDPDWKRDTGMIERYLAIGTRNYADFSPFENAAVAQGKAKGAATGLPRGLSVALGGTRGAAFTNFGLAWVDLTIEPAEKSGKETKK